MKNILTSSPWIQSPVYGGAHTAAPVPYFRREFSIPSSSFRATLHITALGIYEVYMNGEPAHEDRFAPGWSDYTKRVPFRSYDVTSLLRAGDNAIGVILGDGWYCGKLAWRDRQIYGDRPKLKAALVVQFDNDEQLVVATDDSWKTATGPLLESDILGGETYDARREPGNWAASGFDDRNWSAVLVVDPQPAPELCEPISPPVLPHEILPGKRFGNQSDRQCYTFDFGQNLTGHIRLRIKGRPGIAVQIRHAEVIDEDGALYTTNLRSARATDSYTCRSAGEEIWQPRFTFHGFRYVEVRARATPFECSVEAVVLHSATPRTGHFDCSNPLLNQLYHNIVWGQKGNFLEVPTDCPQRDERLGWTGDAQVFCRTACFNMDVRLFFHKWLRDMRDSQQADGSIPAVAPNPGIVGNEGGPAWSDAAIICPWTIYLCYGDRDILRDNYEMMQRYFRYMEAAPTTHEHIRMHRDVATWAGYGDWLALDGSVNCEGITPKNLIGTAFFAHGARILEKVATVLDKPADAADYRKVREQVVQAFQRQFVTRGGLLASATQTAYVLALHFDLLPEEARPVAARELARDVEKRGIHLATGFVGTPYLLDALEQGGRLDLAWKLLEQEEFPFWLFPVKSGATTIWERWNGWTPEHGFADPGMNSFNHYAYGAVGDWMVRSAAGLDLDESEPGYQLIRFRPRPGGSVTWAEASLETPHGHTRIRWELNDDTLNLHLTVPEGARASLDMGKNYADYPVEFAAGSFSVAAKKISTLP